MKFVLNESDVVSTTSIEGSNSFDLAAEGIENSCFKIPHTSMAPDTSHKISKPHPLLKDVEIRVLLVDSSSNQKRKSHIPKMKGKCSPSMVSMYCVNYVISHSY